VDLFVMATDVDGVYEGWGTPTQRRVLRVMTPAELRSVTVLPPGSMGPKVEAAADFVRSAPGAARPSVQLEDIERIVAGTAGTNIIPQA
jgi:carbamate kinase